MIVKIFKTILYVVLLPVRFCLYLINKGLEFVAYEVKELQDLVTPPVAPVVPLVPAAPVAPVAPAPVVQDLVPAPVVKVE